jgi:4-diphosphocytidyl-2-C-methyl-D-erythritol kinase
MSLFARVAAQAKINLRLRILAREDTGFHSLETIFARIDLADDVLVRIGTGRSMDCSGPSLPDRGLGPVEKNLAYLAASAYAEATGWPTGFSIEVTKHIPVGGGLGGGSADAGAVLRALDALSPNPLSARLLELATPLGADVPFMAIDSPMALAWGRGERMMPLRALDRRPVVLLVPDFAVNTAEAYGWLASDRGRYEPLAAALAPESVATWENLSAVATNDFERVVARRHSRILELVDTLASSDALVAMMSGSGSTVFGVFAEVPDIAALAQRTGVTPILTATSDRVVTVGLSR